MTKDINGQDRPCEKCKHYREIAKWCLWNNDKRQIYDTCSMWEEDDERNKKASTL